MDQYHLHIHQQYLSLKGAYIIQSIGINLSQIKGLGVINHITENHQENGGLKQITSYDNSNL